MKRVICEKRLWTDTKLTHTHDFGHLIFPLTGELMIETKYQSVAINNSALCFLPPACTHMFFSPEQWTECLVVDIPACLVPSIAKLTEESGKCLHIDTNWHALRTLFLTEACRKDAAVNYLIYYALHLLVEEEASPSLRYIRDHYFENIAISTLAKLEHYNVAYYGQWFQRKMGITPKQYIQQLRLAEAKRLLRETNFSISAITQQVGYNQPSYLTRLFMQTEGLTPSQYKSYNKDKII